MAADLPAGFVECDSGECPEPDYFDKRKKNGQMGKYVALPKPAKKKKDDDEKCKPPCRCELFLAKDEKKPKWNLAFPDPDGFVWQEEGYVYKFFCVKPVFKEADKYALCDAGCPDPKKDYDMERIGDEYRYIPFFHCEPSAKCKGDCQCRLFSLEKAKSDAKWVFSGNQGERKRSYDDTDIYRCFCTKKS